MKITRESGTQQYEHVAAIAHGAHPEYRLEFDAYVSATPDTVAGSLKIRQGSIVHVNEDGEYQIGCPAGENLVFPVPCISMKNIYDPDVTTGRDTGNYRTSQWCPVGGKITAIPLTGSYEIETTEFKAVEGTNPYVPGAALVPGAGDDIGLIVLATEMPGGSEPYCGFVSKAPYAPQVSYMHNRLSFFANFIPAGSAAGSEVAEKITGTEVTDIEVTGTGSTIAWSYDDTAKKLTATLS